MTDNERHIILWLMSAMTLPINYDQEHYYYDGHCNDFFDTIKSIDIPFGFGILNKFDHHYSKEIEADLCVRLELINDESSEIVEIPRINIAEKIDIQLQFLSRLSGTINHNELIQAVEGQQDDYKFVLDTALIENYNCDAMAPYWDDFKLQTVYNLLISFGSVIGITLISTNN